MGDFFLTGSLGYIQSHLLLFTENFTFDPSSDLLFLLSPPLRMLFVRFLWHKFNQKMNVPEGISVRFPKSR